MMTAINMFKLAMRDEIPWGGLFEKFLLRAHRVALKLYQ